MADTPDKPNPPSEPLNTDGRPTTASPARVHSSQLFRGQREIEIEHGGRLYRLRITQNDKLILTA